MHVAICEYFLQQIILISCEIRANKSLFVLGLNKRLSDSTIGVWSIVVNDE